MTGGIDADSLREWLAREGYGPPGVRVHLPDNGRERNNNGNGHG